MVGLWGRSGYTTRLSPLRLRVRSSAVIAFLRFSVAVETIYPLYSAADSPFVQLASKSVMILN